jgi:recombinational DNA repair protein RecR
VLLSQELKQALLMRRELNLKAQFVFETSNGKRDTKLLQVIKRVARRAGLNCGECWACRERQECSKFMDPRRTGAVL